MKTGSKGERIAAALLIKQGYEIIKQNYRESWGELDIIARDKDKTVVFIEVKALNGGGWSGLKPEDHLTSDKLKRLRKLSSFYANNNPGIIDKKKGWRIDLIALTIYDNYCDASHYKNIA